MHLVGPTRGDFHVPFGASNTANRLVPFNFIAENGGVCAGVEEVDKPITTSVMPLTVEVGNGESRMDRFLAVQDTDTILRNSYWLLKLKFDISSFFFRPIYFQSP